MENFILYNDLYDCYGILLTDKQKLYFEDYYFKDLSLSEISIKYEISRNAIYRQIQITINKLKEYEDKLNLLKKRKKLEIIIENINEEDIKRELENLI